VLTAELPPAQFPAHTDTREWTMKELLGMIAKACVNEGQEMNAVFICGLFDPGTPPTPPNPNPSEPLPGPSEPIPPDPQGNLVRS
jgi:hypothetical protein